MNLGLSEIEIKRNWGFVFVGSSMAGLPNPSRWPTNCRLVVNRVSAEMAGLWLLSHSRYAVTSHRLIGTYNPSSGLTNKLARAHTTICWGPEIGLLFLSFFLLVPRLQRFCARDQEKRSGKGLSFFSFFSCRLLFLYILWEATERKEKRKCVSATRECWAKGHSITLRSHLVVNDS